jgi:hypothetical protein
MPQALDDVEVFPEELREPGKVVFDAFQDGKVGLPSSGPFRILLFAQLLAGLLPSPLVSLGTLVANAPVAEQLARFRLALRRR